MVPACLPLIAPGAARAHGTDLELAVAVPRRHVPPLARDSLDPQHRPVRRDQASRVEIPPPHDERVARAGLTQHDTLDSLGGRSGGAPRQNGEGRSWIGDERVDRIHRTRSRARQRAGELPQLFRKHGGGVGSIQRGPALVGLLPVFRVGRDVLHVAVGEPHDGHGPGLEPRGAGALGDGALHQGAGPRRDLGRDDAQQQIAQADHRELSDLGQPVLPDDELALQPAQSHTFLALAIVRVGTDGMPAFLEADREDPEQAPVVQPSAAVFRAAQCGRAGLGIRAEARVALQAQGAERHADAQISAQAGPERVEQGGRARGERVTGRVDVATRGGTAQPHPRRGRVTPFPRRGRGARTARPHHGAQRRRAAARLHRPIGGNVSLRSVRDEVISRAAPAQRVYVPLEPPLDDPVDAGVEQLVLRGVRRAVHSEHAEGAGRPVCAVRTAAPLIDPQQGPQGIHGAMRWVEPGRHRYGRRPLGLVAQEGLVAPVTRVSPHRGGTPADPCRAQISLGVQHRAGEARHQELDHRRVVAHDLRRALIVLALGVEMTGARVHVRGRYHKAVRADPGRIANAQGGETVKVRSDVRQVGDDERHSLARSILDQEGTRVQAHAIARGAAALGAVAGQPDAGRGSDVGAAEPRPKAG